MLFKARLCFLWRLAAQLHRSCPLPCSSINYLKVRQLDFFSSKNIKPEFIFVLLLVAKHFSSGCKGLSKAFSLREKVISFLKKNKKCSAKSWFSFQCYSTAWTSVLLSAKLGNSSSYFHKSVMQSHSSLWSLCKQGLPPLASLSWTWASLFLSVLWFWDEQLWRTIKSSQILQCRVLPNTLASRGTVSWHKSWRSIIQHHQYFCCLPTEGKTHSKISGTWTKSEGHC